MLTDPELQEPGSESSDTSEDVDHSILCVKDKLSPRLSGGVHTQYIVHDTYIRVLEFLSGFYGYTKIYI